MTPPLPPGFAFARSWLDRADSLRGDARALAAAWRQARVMVVDAQGRAAGDGSGPLALEASALDPELPPQALLLGLAGDGQAWFALPAEGLDLPGSPAWIDLRQAAVQWEAAAAAAFAHARGMLHWHARSRHCGACGAPVRLQRAGYQGLCSGCGIEHYPRVDPAVIVAVSDGQRLLLGRQPGWPPRRWSVLAGYVEPGETLEQAAAREVHEESRVRLRACRYLASQPWPFPGALMLGFLALAEPDAPQVDGELEDARWFDRDEVGAALARDESSAEGWLLPPPLSIARALVAHWHAHGLEGLAAP